MRAQESKSFKASTGACSLHVRRESRKKLRLAVAIGAALFLHALLFLLPLAQPQESTEAPRPVLSIIKLEEPKADASRHEKAASNLVGDKGAPEEMAETKTAREPATKEPPLHAGALDELEAGRPAAVPTPEIEPRHAGPGESIEEADVEASELARLPQSLQEVDLFPHAAIFGVVSEEGAKMSAADAGETLSKPPVSSAAERNQMATRRIASFVRDEKARQRVESGLIDPYFVRLRETFEDGFTPAWEHFDEDAESGLANDLAAWFRDHQGSMKRYAETGSPYREGEASSVGPHHPLAHPSGPAGTRGAHDSREDMRQQQMMSTLFFDIARGRTGGVDVVALLRVTQSPTGVLLRIEIERSSGKRAYDDLARAAIRRSLASPRLPRPADEGLGLDGDQIESLWAFRTRFVVVPLMPMIGCELEMDGGDAECFEPLQQRALPRIDLQAVY